MASEDDSIVAEFVVESREHLADIENQLLEIEAAGADIDDDLVNTVFRAVHSIKGVAGFLDFTNLKDLAHSLENVLNLIRNREIVPDSTNVDVMLRAADTLSRMIDDVQNSNDINVSEHVAELEQVAGIAAMADDTGGTPPVSGERVIPGRQPAPAADDSGSAQDQNQQPPESAKTKQDSAQRGALPDGFEAAETSIRVPVRLLDSMMNLAGELVLARNQLVQQVGGSRQIGLESVASRVDSVTSELQEAIMQARMQVVGTVFNRFPRVVRNLSSHLGKQCRLLLEGKEVELDKSIIEAMSDPLTHLVRNAVDHGIELPKWRERAGKPARGTIVLRAFHLAGKVNVSISDDGAGIDVSCLKEKAVARGLITPEQAGDMCDREALRLIFHPGFSMAREVTDVSGRGVGMDVVKTNIERLGGVVDIETKLGQGTTINIKLPLTLAIIPSLIVQCREDRFAIPQANIRELVRIRARDAATKIEKVKDSEVFRLRGVLLPLVHLDHALGIHDNGGGGAWGASNIIVVEAGHLRYGLIVDKLHDSEEIVVKPLGRHMRDCHCLAGATVLGDGQVALILDIAGIASRMNLLLQGNGVFNEVSSPSGAGSSETQSVLMFTNDPKEQFGIPMTAVARVEQVLRDQIDTVGGQEVLQYRGASLPLLRLDDCIRSRPAPATDKPYVIVFIVRNREVGLIVPALLDIRDITTDVDTVTFREPGVIGSVEVDGKALRLLDTYKLAQIAHPKWFEESDWAAAPTPLLRGTGGDTPLTILVAEDSDFFRSQVVGYLEEVGFNVVACEDGLVAWDTLQKMGEQVDAVVTDIEMPNLDGRELTRRIKGSAQLAHLPVIALTSLASEKDARLSMEAGIDDYQIKLDREHLTASLATHLRDRIQVLASKAGSCDRCKS